MWKCNDFSITQILREINFEDSRVLKSAILTHLEAQNFVNLAIHKKNQNLEPLNLLK